MTNRLKHYRRLFVRFLLVPIGTAVEAEILKELDVVGSAMSGLEKAEARLLAKHLGKMTEEELHREYVECDLAGEEP